MNKSLSLYLGALSDSLEKQLTEQGFEFDKKEIEHFQKDMDALNRIRIRGYIGDSQIERIDQKLFNKIKAHITQKNKLKKAKA